MPVLDHISVVEEKFSTLDNCFATLSFVAEYNLGMAVWEK